MTRPLGPWQEGTKLSGSGEEGERADNTSTQLPSPEGQDSANKLSRVMHGLRSAKTLSRRTLDKTPVREPQLRGPLSPENSASSAAMRTRSHAPPSRPHLCLTLLLSYNNFIERWTSICFMLLI